jgi:hypothetical protein
MQASRPSPTARSGRRRQCAPLQAQRRSRAALQAPWRCRTLGRERPEQLHPFRRRLYPFCDLWCCMQAVLVSVVPMPKEQGMHAECCTESSPKYLRSMPLVSFLVCHLWCMRTCCVCTMLGATSGEAGIAIVVHFMCGPLLVKMRARLLPPAHCGSLYCYRCWVAAAELRPHTHTLAWATRHAAMRSVKKSVVQNKLGTPVAIMLSKYPA